MNPRVVSLYMAGVIIAGALGAGGYTLWPRDHSVAPDPGTNPPTAAVSTPARGSAHAVPSFIHLGPALSASTLKWSPMAALMTSRPKPASRRDDDGAGVRMARTVERPPLDLQFPVDKAVNIGPANDSTSTDSSAVDRTSENTRSLVMDVNPNIDDQDFDSATYPHLFNHDNGLRGFMARGWLNSNVGLQGGLAVSREYLRERDGSLQQNMAIGMGVMLAF